MRISTVLLMVMFATAGGFYLGRGSASDAESTALAPAPRISQNQSALRPAAPETRVPVDGGTALLRALERPAKDRNRTVRQAMHAWLAADGATALSAVQDDPKLSGVANRMTHFALYAHPEVFIDDPSLLDGLPDARQSIAAAVPAIATYDPATARALIAARFAETGFALGLLSVVERVNADRPEPVEDAYAELEAILAERNGMTRFARLRHLIGRIAEDDPAAAATLIDSLPGRSADEAIGPLIDIWSQSDPEAAAHWLAGKNAQFAWERLNHLARRWGSADFDSASAYGDTLTGAHRSAFLTGLAGAGPHGSTGEMLDWLSRYEGDQAYPDLVGSVAQRLAREDFGAALTLLDTLPLESRMESLMGIVPALVMRDPEAAIDAIVERQDESMPDFVLPMTFSIWAQLDAGSALDRVLELGRSQARDNAIASVAGALVRYDVGAAIDAIDAIDDAEIRRQSIRQVLTVVPSDEEAIRLGRGHGFGRDAVLELRAHWHGRGSLTSFSSDIDSGPVIVSGEPGILQDR